MSPANFRPPGLTVFSLSEDAEVAANKLLKSDVGGWQLWDTGSMTKRVCCS